MHTDLRAGDLVVGDTVTTKYGVKLKIVNIALLDYGPNKTEGIEITFRRNDGRGIFTKSCRSPYSKLKDMEKKER